MKGKSTEGKDRSSVIKKMCESGSLLDAKFLAAICFHHTDHGGLENSAFASMVKHKHSKLLYSLLQNARSTCTAKQSIHALAELKEKRAFNKILSLLSSDVRPFWHMDVAGALVKYGDAKAVPVLVDFINASHVQKKLSRDDDPMSSGMGLTSARIRALMALGSFASEKKQIDSVLAIALKNPQLMVAALATKYLMNKSAKNRDLLKKAILEEDGLTSRSVFVDMLYSKDADLKSLAKEIEIIKKDKKKNAINDDKVLDKEDSTKKMDVPN
jgi:hypothetical protein